MTASQRLALVKFAAFQTVDLGDQIDKKKLVARRKLLTLLALSAGGALNGGALGMRAGAGAGAPDNAGGGALGGALAGGLLGGGAGYGLGRLSNWANYPEKDASSRLELMKRAGLAATLDQAMGSASQALATNGKRIAALAGPTMRQASDALAPHGPSGGIHLPPEMNDAVTKIMHNIQMSGTRARHMRTGRDVAIGAGGAFGLQALWGKLKSINDRNRQQQQPVQAPQGGSIMDMLKSFRMPTLPGISGPHPFQSRPAMDEKSPGMMDAILHPNKHSGNI